MTLTDNAPLDSDTHAAPGAADHLRSARAVRERAAGLLARARADQSIWFTIDDTALATAADEVATVTRARYPGLRIPYHSRWRHFEAGGLDRRAQLDRLLGDATPRARAQAHIDLAVVSVLLDAGTGPGWKYFEPASGQTFTRSEGLGVASFHAFTTGMFSSDPQRPLQADAAGLRGVITDHLALAFQVNEGNPLIGLEGRATLLRRLGETLHTHPGTYGQEGRPGGLFDELANTPSGEIPPTAEVQAHDILETLLDTLSGIWPARNAIDGVPLGDCWRHAGVPGPGLTAGWMPFHKLSQWLTYSLLEPFEWAGVKVRGLDALTALPEYRNGGLLLDTGVIVPREAGFASREWQPGDECIVEWRALTVALIDELAPLVRERLGLDAERLPLACVLEGGTWAAGRATAARLRAGVPPLRVVSDGTVF